MRMKPITNWGLARFAILPLLIACPLNRRSILLETRYSLRLDPTDVCLQIYLKYLEPILGYRYVVVFIKKLTGTRTIVRLIINVGKRNIGHIVFVEV